MPWYRKLHWQIILGLVSGLVFGIVAAANGWGEFIRDWVAPFGTIFMNLLKLIAVPLILASLITGVASLGDVRKLSRIGGKTIGLYVGTTAIAIVIGLLVVNLLQPGETVPPEMRDRLQTMYQGEAAARAESAAALERGPLQPIVDMVPENIFGAASSNRNMLQVVFFAIFAGIGLLMVPRKTAEPLITFFSSVNDLIIKMTEIIMKGAPYGVFALIAATITSIAQDNLQQVVELLAALGYYCLAVVGALVVHSAIVYPIMLRTWTPYKVGAFFSRLAPVQLLAFSTSSSNATLPVTMDIAEKQLGISEEVSSFALPLGATINMNGTALYQAVAAVFIAQTLGMNLDLVAQATIVLTATLAAIGTAGVPSAGIVTLVVILETVGVPSAGIALIFGVDRILDMIRTVVNVTGDVVTATVVAATEGQLEMPA